MLAVESPRAFFEDPRDHFAVSAHFVVWCYRTELLGAVMWGRPDEAELTFLVTLWALDQRMSPGYETVTDTSQLEALDPTRLEALFSAASDQPCETGKARRHALVCPPLPGPTVVAGFFSHFEPRHDRRLFDNRTAAFAALEHPDAMAVGQEVDALVVAARARGPLLGELRAYLRAGVREASIDGAARALGRSRRTLQRQLGMAGTSFRTELERTRAQVAEELIQDGALKLAAVAERVGCSSPSQLTRLVRRFCGATPTELRGR